MSFNFMWAAPSAGAPVVSIAPYGMTFNSAAIDLLNSPMHVRIGFDENKKVIGVMPVHDVGEVDHRCFQFYERLRQGSVRINSRDFVRYVASRIGRDFSTVTTRYGAIWDNIGGLLVIELEKPMDGDEVP